MDLYRKVRRSSWFLKCCRILGMISGRYMMCAKLQLQFVASICMEFESMSLILRIVLYCLQICESNSVKCLSMNELLIAGAIVTCQRIALWNVLISAWYFFVFFSHPTWFNTISKQKYIAYYAQWYLVPRRFYSITSLHNCKSSAEDTTRFGYQNSQEVTITRLVPKRMLIQARENFVKNN